MRSKIATQGKLNKKTSRSFFTLRIVLLISGLVVGGAALAIADAYKRTNMPKIREESTVANIPLVQATAPAPGANYVRPSRLRPQLRETLMALGDRLTRPGKERLIFMGTLSRMNGALMQTSAFRLILEFPGRLRLEEQDGSQWRVTVFNGRNALTTRGSINEQDEALIETLVYDSVDGYFIGQMKGLATRFLGNRFRMDDGQDDRYQGPFYDIYQVADQIQLNSSTRVRDKLYYLNSDTQLLERVRYEAERSGSKTKVEIQISDWQTVQSQTLPARIQRLENAQAVLIFNFTSALVMPQAQDGIFDKP